MVENKLLPSVAHFGEKRRGTLSESQQAAGGERSCRQQHTCCVFCVQGPSSWLQSGFSREAIRMQAGSLPSLSHLCPFNSASAHSWVWKSGLFSQLQNPIPRLFSFALILTFSLSVLSWDALICSHRNAIIRNQPLSPSSALSSFCPLVNSILYWESQQLILITIKYVCILDDFFHWGLPGESGRLAEGGCVWAGNREQEETGRLKAFLDS